jgi:hypothetical protein
MRRDVQLAILLHEAIHIRLYKGRLRENYRVESVGEAIEYFASALTAISGSV